MSWLARLLAAAFSASQAPWQSPTQPNVVTTGIKPSSNIGSALVSAMYDRSSELGLVSNLHLRISV